MDTRRTLLIACGALAREIAALKRANGWTSLDVRCLPAQLHNRPERIAPAVRAEIQANRARYAQMFVVYADCGTGGQLDAVLKEEGVERLPGAHCYEFLARPQVFARSEEHTSELQSPCNLVCRLLLEKKNKESGCLSQATSQILD